MKTLREYIDLVDGKISESIDVGGISHSIVPHPGGRYQVVVKHGDKVAHTSLHNSEDDAKKSLASQVAHSKKMLKVDEADETSWTANSAQFRKEEDLSWPVEITLEPRDDINRGRGAQVKTMTVTGQSRDAAKKKLVDYFRKNGWEVTGIKFTGDLDESDSGDYDYPYNMSARDKGRYDAMTGREYNNPYSAFGTQEDHNNAIEYSAAYDSASKQDVNEDEAQEYTVRVVDEEGSGYTVKVTATSEQGALHKAIVKVRNSGARPEHARIIRQDVEEQATPEAIARIEQLSSK